MKAKRKPSAPHLTIRLTSRRHGDSGRGRLRLQHASETLKIGQPFFDADFVEAARHLKSDILLGTYIAESPSGNEAGSNNALLITPNGTVNGRYDKRNLIPFFEDFPTPGSAKVWAGYCI